MTSVSDSNSSMMHTSPVSDLKNCHLDGSRLFKFQSLSSAIKAIGEHSITYGAVVELNGEIQWNGLASRILSKCNEEFLFSSYSKVMLHSQDRKEMSTWIYNAAALMRQMATSIVYRYLEEVLTTLGVLNKCSQRHHLSNCYWR